MSDGLFDGWMQHTAELFDLYGMPANATMLRDLRKRFAELQTALKPFAECAGRFHDYVADAETDDCANCDEPSGLLVGDFRRAAGALKGGAG